YSAFYWDGLRQHRISLQQCDRCGQRRFPPMPGCPHCGATAWTEVAIGGEGAVYSWVRVHRALTEEMTGEVPYSVAVVDLDGGGRMVARVDEPSAVAVGARATPHFVDHATWTELRYEVAGR
ncbi:MAG: Zn-ribbon domain-containing OB-fold protein, partial [Acidimicrobiales bacterium]